MYAIIDQDLKIALDPYAGKIADMDETNVVSNLAVLGDRIDKLEVLSNDLMNSLDPTTTPHCHPDAPSSHVVGLGT